MTEHPANHPTMPLSVFLITAVVAGFSSCGILGSDDNERKLLNVTTVSAVEAFLDIRAFPGAEITIERDDEEIFSFRMSQADTLLTDSGLQPATDYRWTAVNKNGFNRTETRRAATLDTTSQEFTWQTVSFGEHSSSVLRGVSIIDENNIWAVGEIYMNDPTGQADSNRYNAIHWNGEEWRLKKVPYIYNGISFYNPIQTIYSFNKNSVFFAGNGVVHFDSTLYNPKELPENVWDANIINKFFGESENDIYIAGDNGSIAHYNGQIWQKIETGTDLDVYDIHGNDEQGVVAIAAKRLVNSRKNILKITNDLQTEVLSTDGIPYSIHGIWFDDSGVTYLAGRGIYRKSNMNSPARWQPLHEGITNNYLQAIDANGLNDLVVVGDFGEFLHFNGANWKSFQQEFDGNLLLDVAIRDSIVVAVGLDGRQSFVTIGIRE